MDYKTGKLLNIVRQFDKSNGKYEINGIDVGEAVFLYRKKSEMFMPIPKGNYNITKENNNTFLNVDNVINDKAVEYQIVYETSIKSSEYKDPYPELKILVQKYNEAVLDIFNISKSIKTTGVKIDSKYQTQILTPLEPSSTWYMNSNGIIDTLPLDDFNKKFKEIIEKIRDTADEKAQEQVIKRLETLKEEIETFKNTKTSEILESIKNIKETYIDEITKISNSSKQELESKMPEINNKFNENILHATGKEYGGILNNAGNKIAGKTYFDNNTKKLFLCLKNNNNTSANTENFKPIDNNSNFERLENLYNIKTHRFSGHSTNFVFYLCGNLVLGYFNKEGSNNSAISNTTLIGNLPIEFRPKVNLTFMGTSTDAPSTTEVKVQTDGNVLLKRTQGVFSFGTIIYFTN